MKQGWLDEQLSLTEKRTKELPEWKQKLREIDKEVLLAKKQSIDEQIDPTLIPKKTLSEPEE